MAPVVSWPVAGRSRAVVHIHIHRYVFSLSQMQSPSIYMEDQLRSAQFFCSSRIKDTVAQGSVRRYQICLNKGTIETTPYVQIYVKLRTLIGQESFLWL